MTAKSVGLTSEWNIGLQNVSPIRHNQPFHLQQLEI